MTLAYSVRAEKRDKIPAPTHVDGTGRLQTVTREANPRYHALISAFRDLTGVPVVLNTSFTTTSPSSAAPKKRSIASCARRWMLWFSRLLISRRDI